MNLAELKTWVSAHFWKGEQVAAWVRQHFVSRLQYENEAVKLAATQSVTNKTLDSTNVASLTAKNPPIDADSVVIVDSAASNVFKRVTWANIKATLKAYFDTLYAALPTVGTWTPTITGSTGAATVSYTTQSGHYTRIGNVVHAWGYIVINTISGGTGSTQVNLPVAGNSAPNWMIGNCVWHDSSASQFIPGACIASGSNVFPIIGTAFLPITSVQAGDTIGVSVTYRAA